MTDLVVIHANAVWAKLAQAPSGAEKTVAALLQYSVANGMSGLTWTTAYNWNKKLFQAGFLRLVVEKLQVEGFKVRVLRQAAPAALGPAVKDCVVDDYPADPRYDYQPETVLQLMAHRAITAKVSTGGGKTRICKIAYKHIGRKALFVTTRSSLMYQMKASVEESMGEVVGVIGDSTFKPSANGLTVATVASLAPYLTPYNVEKQIEAEIKAAHTAKGKKMAAVWQQIKKKHKGIEAKRKYAAVEQALERKMPKLLHVRAKKEQQKIAHDKKRAKILEFLHSVEFLICEEAQEISSNGYYGVAMECKNAHYRLGLTATPGMSDNDEANMRLYAACGTIGIEVSEKQLIDLGILATPTFKFIDNPAPEGLVYGSSWQKAQKFGIVENNSRNALIVKEVIRAQEYKLPCLLLVLRKAHGDILKKMLQNAGIENVTFIQGSSKEEVRQRALETLKHGCVVIATIILDVGIDCPALTVLFKCGGGKAESGDRQRTGRALRAKYDTPNVCFIIDFRDRHVKVLAEHSLMRQSIVKSTPGFAEGLLSDDEDFDYSIFSKAA